MLRSAGRRFRAVARPVCPQPALVLPRGLLTPPSGQSASPLLHQPVVSLSQKNYKKMLFSTTTASPPSPPATGHFSEDKARGPASGEEPEEEKFFLDRTLREQAPEVSPNWHEFTKRDGQPYYVHAKTGQTTWQHPVSGEVNRGLPLSRPAFSVNAADSSDSATAGGTSSRSSSSPGGLVVNSLPLLLFFAFACLPLSHRLYELTYAGRDYKFSQSSRVAPAKDMAL